MISDTRARSPEGDRAGSAPTVVADVAATGTGTRTATEPTVGGTAEDDAGTPDRARPAVPVVPLLGALLVLLVAAAVVLWLTRPEPSAIRTGDYVDALQAARSHVVDLTSFDHVTLDDDIRQIEQVATEELGRETIAQLDARRQQITESEAVVSTEVVGAGITRADVDDAVALMVIESTQRSNAAEQAQVLRYRIEVELAKVDDRWLLSAIRGG
ncbi:hypothetical protein ABC795_15315 [Blastococcus sp. HT6-30]|uniref:hypothetical protein n=1 Tax=Blastococcus sp. HT6-30 TaxID=3144843 RepID=UPI00321B9EB5